MLCRFNLSAATPRFYVHHWDTGDGLPENAVFATIQTRDGYLWLGTLDGLARFDGLHFEKFYDANTPGLNSTKIFQVFEDSQTNLWVGTANAGLIKVDAAGKILPIPLRPEPGEPRVSTICEDSSGTIWIVLSSGRVYTCREDKPSLLL